MNCKNCGAAMPEDTRFCPECGEPVGVQLDANAQPAAGMSAQYAAQPAAPADKYQGFSMKWHKFLVYFALWAGALVNLFSGYMMLAGCPSRDSCNTSGISGTPHCPAAQKP